MFDGNRIFMMSLWLSHVKIPFFQLPWKIAEEVRSIVYSHNYLQVVPNMRMFNMLYRLDLSHNLIGVIRNQVGEHMT